MGPTGPRGPMGPAEKYRKFRFSNKKACFLIIYWPLDSEPDEIVFLRKFPDCGIWEGVFF